MSTITKPSVPGWQEVEPVYEKKLSRSISPFTGASQAQVWPGENYRFRFSFPPMKSTAGLLAIKFVRDLENGDNLWVENVTKYVASDVSDKAAMSLRIVPGSASIRIGRDSIYHVSFDAEKAQ